MAENSGISWTHNTQNFWEGCEKVAPECAKCYIERTIFAKHHLTWGEVYRCKTTWGNPWKWEKDCVRNNYAKRIFTCSLSDFFHKEADLWRKEAWAIIKHTPHLVWLVLTKRPDRIAKHLPGDWGDGYPNVWLGVSTGCRRTLTAMDMLRKIPAAVRWISSEPLLEDISAEINLDGFGWVVTGGESGSGNEYLWNPEADWKAELKDHSGRRTMQFAWATALRDKVKAAGLPFMFKQVTAPTSGHGYNALDGKDWHEFPVAPKGLEWAPRQAIPSKYRMTKTQIEEFKDAETSG